MTAFICETCGVQHAPRADRPDEPPERCPTCEDDRQYVGWNGQRWTTVENLREGGRTNEVTEVEPGLHAIGTKPGFAIGQRALLVRTAAGNLLWDCTPLLGDETVAQVRALGGIAAIAISHPHFYSTCVEWSRAFGDAPVFLHAADKQWVMRPDKAIRHWDGATADPLPGSGLTLVNVGGHFPGCQALLWPAGAGGRGALFCGDVPQVVQDRRYVSFMYSYPNLIPLPAREVERIAAVLAPYRFDRLYGGWTDRVVDTDAHAAVQRSAARYAEHLRG